MTRALLMLIGVLMVMGFYLRGRICTTLATTEVDAYARLGRPTGIPLRRFRSDSSLSRFVYRREYEQLGNAKLTRQCRLLRIYEPALLMFMAVSFWFVA